MERDRFELRKLLSENIDRLRKDGRFVGEMEFTGDEIYGDLYFPEIMDSLISLSENHGHIQFMGDSVRCDLNLFFSGIPVYVGLEAELLSDSISGEGYVESDLISADFDIFSVRDAEGDYDIIIAFDLYRLVLPGRIEFFQPDLTKLLWGMNQWSSDFGFENANISIRGDSCIHYQSLEFEGLASIQFLSRQIGEREGCVRADSGRIWRFGKPFDIIFAEYDFGTGAVKARAEHKTRAYIPGEEGGSVLQDYTLTLSYYGGLPDSVKWELESIPRLSREQIISLLVKGDPFSQEISGKIASTMEEKIKLAIEEYDSHRFTGYTERKAGRLLMFDRVEIEGNVFSFGSPYEADKEITKRLKLSLRGTVGGTASQTVSFDYRLGRNFSIISETNQYGKSGLDLRYMIKFK